MASKTAAFFLRRIAGTHADLRRVKDDSGAAGHVCDSGEWRAKVSLHVHGQRLQRADVDDSTAFAGRFSGMKHQAIQAPEKGSERFARARGRKDERAFSAGDSGPPEPLGSGGSVEDSTEPLRRHRMEESQWICFLCFLHFTALRHRSLK